MAKTATKFTAQFTIKIGKTPVVVNIPLDFTQAQPDQSFAEYVTAVQDTATRQLSHMIEASTLKLKNQGDLKRAHKAFSKSQQV